MGAINGHQVEITEAGGIDNMAWWRRGLEQISQSIIQMKWKLNGKERHVHHSPNSGGGRWVRFSEASVEQLLMNGGWG